MNPETLVVRQRDRDFGFPIEDIEGAILTIGGESARGGLDDGGHGAGAARQTRIGAVGVNLVASELGLRLLARNNDSAAATVDFLGVPESLLERKDEEHLQHFDHVVVTVIVIVEQDNPVE